MKAASFRLPEQSIVPTLAQKVEAAGGRLIVVGGWVRDCLNEDSSNDLDLEIFGLSRDQISELLAPFHFSKPVGRQFPVWRETRQGIDVAFPRAAARPGPSNSREALESAFREASRHRDLTINAIGWDPIANELIDPWKGRRDLEARRLRAVSEETFADDPLRVIRVARLCARFDASVDDGLEGLCRGIDLDGLAPERIARELCRILCESPMPSIAFGFLKAVDQLRVFAPIEALCGVGQDPHWHPEGDVFVHTCLVVDRAAAIAREEKLAFASRELLVLAALCHDLGKPETTTIEKDGRVRSIGHESLGAQRTGQWLRELRLADRTVSAVEALVAHHLAPAQFVGQGAGARAYRRLARKLATAGVDLIDLERVARADHLGRTTEEARAGRFDQGAVFLAAATAAEVAEGVREDVVTAALLMDRGIAAGPSLGRLLARCREIEDESGSREAAWIMDRALADRDSD